MERIKGRPNKELDKKMKTKPVLYVHIIYHNEVVYHEKSKCLYNINSNGASSSFYFGLQFCPLYTKKYLMYRALD